MKILIFLLMLVAASGYVSVPRYYDQSIYVFQHPFRFAVHKEGMKGIMIPGYTNYLMYNERGFMLSTFRHHRLIVEHPIKSITLMEPIPGSHEAFAATTDLKLKRINYLTGEILQEVSTNEVVNVMDIHPYLKI